MDFDRKNIENTMNLGSKEEVIFVLKDSFTKGRLDELEYSLGQLWPQMNKHFVDDPDSVFKLLNQIFSTHPTNEKISRHIKDAVTSCRELEYKYFKKILWKFLKSDELKTIKHGIHIAMTRLIREYESCRISVGESKALFHLIRRIFFRLDDRSARISILDFLSKFPREDLTEPFFYQLWKQPDDDEIWADAVFLYGDIVNRNPKLLPKFISMLGPNVHGGLIGIRLVFSKIEEIINSHSEPTKKILFKVYGAFIKNRDVIFEPKLKIQMMALKYDIVFQRAYPFTCRIIKDIVHEKSMKKGQYGWYYERYLDFENEFCNILNYVPLKESLDSEYYGISSPKIVNLHIQLGTWIESTVNDYLDKIHIQYPGLIEAKSEDSSFVRKFNALDGIFSLYSLQLTLRDNDVQIIPFKKDSKGNSPRPNWYHFYAWHKHDLITLEAETNLKYLLDALGSFYILTVFHPDNWESIEFDWDSKIFDKYSIVPVVFGID